MDCHTTGDHGVHSLVLLQQFLLGAVSHLSVKICGGFGPNTDGMGVEVCPVHRSEFKSSDISSLNVADMNAETPRGVKRPADNEEEEEEVVYRYRPHTQQERKEWIADALKRLNTHCLRHQVVLCNFIRSVHEDMEREGVPVPEIYDEDNRRRGPHIPEWRPHRSSNPEPSNADSRPGTPSVIQHHHHRVPETEDAVVAMETDQSEDSALWTTEPGDRLNWCSVLSSSFNNGSDAAATSDYISDDSSSSSSSCNLHTLMPAATEMEYFDVPPSTTGSTSPVSSTSPTSSSEDEIFGDVDLTLYDFDCHAMSPPNVAMDPLSAEELVWSLSNDQRQAASSESEKDDVESSALT